LSNDLRGGFLKERINEGFRMKKLFAIIVTLLLLPIVSAQQPTDAGVTPDSFLWGLDKALDQLALLLTFDEGKKAIKGLEIAQERLLEIKEMIEENKLEAAEKAKDSHGKTLVKIKQSIEDIEEDDSEEEIKELIEIEKELEEHDEEIEQTFGELKVKIKIEGEVTTQQIALIESILNSLKGQTGEVEIEIKNKKDKTKIKIKQETGKSEEEIEVEIEDIEKEKGIKKQEKAFDAIEDAEEELEEFLEESEEESIVVSQTLIDQFNSLLELAIIQFDEGNFAEARNLAKQVEKLLDDAEEELEGEEKEIEVEIEEGKAKIKVEIGKEKLKFELDTINLETIVEEISTRTGLSIEEINAIIEVEVKEKEEIEIEAEVERGRTKVKIEIGDEKQRFILDVTSKEDVIEKIMARTGLSEDEIIANLEFKEDEDELEKDALEEFAEVQKNLDEFLEESAAKGVEVTEQMLTDFNALVEQAQAAFDIGDFKTALELLEQSGDALDDVDDLSGDALEEFAEVQKNLDEFLEAAEEEGVEVTEQMLTDFNALVEQAQAAFDIGDFKTALELLEQSGDALDDVVDD